MAGSTDFASRSLKDALRDAPEDAAGHFCEACGRRPRERKRRRDGTWYYYSRCRRCRREIGPAKIREGRLVYLLEILHEHLLKLKEANWQYAPKRVVVQRLRDLISVVKE